MECLRSGDDDFGINKLLIESRVVTVLIRGGHQSVSLVLKPLPNAKLVLRGAKKAWLLSSMVVTLPGINTVFFAWTFRPDYCSRRRVQVTLLPARRKILSVCVCKIGQGNSQPQLPGMPNVNVGKLFEEAAGRAVVLIDRNGGE